MIRTLSTLIIATAVGCASGSQHHDHAHPAPGAQPAGDAQPVVISHAELKDFENNGNVLRGIATASMGAQTFEVWRTSVAVGSQTPPHRHQSEEIFIFLRGKGKAVIGGQIFEFEAPATVIAPANMTHQFFNTGDVPTDAIVVVGVHSTIWNTKGEVMELPWRK